MGNVQGVGFRVTAKSHADRLKLTGFVRNLPNGSVEICAHGEKPQLEKFLSALKEEFSSQYIDEIIYDFRRVKTPYRDFQIVR
jgi:acylphosphatase